MPSLEAKTPSEPSWNSSCSIRAQDVTEAKSPANYQPSHPPTLQDCTGMVLGSKCLWCRGSASPRREKGKLLVRKGFGVTGASRWLGWCTELSRRRRRRRKMLALCHLLHSEFALRTPSAGAITKFFKSRSQDRVCSMSFFYHRLNILQLSYSSLSGQSQILFRWT